MFSRGKERDMNPRHELPRQPCELGDEISNTRIIGDESHVAFPDHLEGCKECEAKDREIDLLTTEIARLRYEMSEPQEPHDE